MTSFKNDLMAQNWDNVYNRNNIKYANHKGFIEWMQKEKYTKNETEPKETENNCIKIQNQVK